MLFLPVASQAQAYLGQALRTVNLRGGPGTEYAVLRSVPAGSSLFVVSEETYSGFYAVVDIDSNKEGYIHSSFVKLVEPLEANQDGVFTPTGRAASDLCELEIYNRTEKVLTLKLDSEIYTFQPHQRTKLNVPPRMYNYRASAPGVLPDFGTERLDAGTAYSWEFYIVTQHQRLWEPLQSSFPYRH
jgi:hypothetical protein